MAMKGERFELNLDPEEAYAQSLGQRTESGPSSSVNKPQAPLGLNFVKDVLEHEPASTAAPPPPTLKQNATSTGFPAHKKRVSKFKQSRGGGIGNAKGDILPGSEQAESGTYLSRMSKVSAMDKQQIDRQTTQLIDSMSEEQVREAQGELMSDPSFAAIRRLLMRSRIDSDETVTGAQDGGGATAGTTVQEATARNQTVGEVGEESKQQEEVGPQRNPSTKKRVSFAANVLDPGSKGRQQKSDKAGSTVPLVLPKNAKPVSTSFRTPFYQTKYSGTALQEINAQPSDSFRSSNKEEPSKEVVGADDRLLEARSKADIFRNSSSKGTASKPEQPLDLNSDTFLTDLHDTYFPNLPSDPKSLAWMAPVKAGAMPDNATASTPPASLRFGFRGEIISAGNSARIPVTKGLHHHGRNPDAAGYTIGELAIYARSTLAAQRCFAYQLVGRILYRLGVGDYKTKGKGGAESRADMPSGPGPGPDAPLDLREEGLWQEIRKGHIIDQIVTEANREAGSGSESARVWAIEAVWLWRQGGGRGFHDDEHDEDGENVMGEDAARILAEGLNPSF